MTKTNNITESYYTRGIIALLSWDVENKMASDDTLKN